jgi:hypothetical protein
MVFAMQGHEVIVITVLRPLTQQGQTFQRGMQKRPAISNVGGLGRKRRSS